MNTAIEWKNLDQIKAWNSVVHAKPVSVRDALTADNAVVRVGRFTVPMAEGLSYNYAAKAVDDDILDALQQLSDEHMLIEKYKALLAGDVINTGEKRKVLHHLIRGELNGEVLFDGRNMRSFYTEQQERIASFADAVHNGKIASENGKSFTDVVQIGIGGSDLGPRAMYLALRLWAKTHNKEKIRAHFISNVDPDDGVDILESLNLERTLFILVSKSGTTQETLANFLLVKDALEKQHLNPSKHVLAVTSQTSPLANNPEYLDSFYMDDFIGGRYSSSSACGGVVLSLAFGADVFADFLAGAHESDKTALATDIRKNPALLDALIGVYERNVLGFETTAVLPYSQSLSRFPAHLQQMDMESNGKSVNRFGEPVNYKTGPIIFGEPGTNGQHSFYQLLHQGTSLVPLQFIGFAESQRKKDVDVDASSSQDKLKANLVAQIYAFATGKDDANPNKAFAGERPSSLIFGKELTPRSLGALLAHFENKVMFQGFVWNINSFDQEGVQLGKVLAKKVLAKESDAVLSALAQSVGL